MNATFRPLPVWPYPVTQGRRWHPFSSGWSQTLKDLDSEVEFLDGSSVIIAAGWRENDIRLDGMPRERAPEPSHPGVELSFDTREHGRLVYATDVCSHWQDNVRSIALGLRALRAVDRYGISAKGQQYAGWKALPTGSGVSTADQAWDILTAAGGSFEPQGDETSDLETLYRQAAKVTHPDTGGDGEAFIRVRKAYEFLKANA